MYWNVWYYKIVFLRDLYLRWKTNRKLQVHQYYGIFYQLCFLVFLSSYACCLKCIQSWTGGSLSTLNLMVYMLWLWLPHSDLESFHNIINATFDCASTYVRSPVSKASTSRAAWRLCLVSDWVTLLDVCWWTHITSSPLPAAWPQPRRRTGRLGLWWVTMLWFWPMFSFHSGTIEQTGIQSLCSYMKYWNILYSFIVYMV